MQKRVAHGSFLPRKLRCSAPKNMLQQNNMDKETIRKTLLWMRLVASEETDVFSHFPYEPTKKDCSINELIRQGARDNGSDLHSAMDAWLDWLLEIFNSDHFQQNNTFFENAEAKAKENSQWYKALCRWIYDTKNDKCTDFFGNVYEGEYKSSGKAKVLGQFFTPQSIADLCANLTNGDSDTIIVNDCACGSGRLLMAGYTANRKAIENNEKFHFFFGSDIDNTSVKMCALNLMIHGLQGIVVNQDALMLSKPRYGYMVNPTNAPIRTGLLSVQYLDSDKCAEYVDWQDEGDVHYNFNRWLSFLRWQWSVVHGKEEPQENQVIELHTICTDNTLATDDASNIKVRKEPIQLSLFD